MDQLTNTTSTTHSPIIHQQGGEVAGLRPNIWVRLLDLRKGGAEQGEGEEHCVNDGGGGTRGWVRSVRGVGEVYQSHISN